MITAKPSVVHAFFRAVAKGIVGSVENKGLDYMKINTLSKVGIPQPILYKTIANQSSRGFRE